MRKTLLILKRKRLSAKLKKIPVKRAKWKEELEDTRGKIKVISNRRRYKKRKYLYNHYLPRVYRKACEQPVDEKKCLFIYDRYREMPDNMRPVYRRLKELGYTCETIAKDGKRRKGLRQQLHSFFAFKEALNSVATAKYTFLMDYYLPVYAITPREGTHLIQLWHACGAFKQFGYSTIDFDWGPSKEILEDFPIHQNYTDVFVSAEKVIDAYQNAFRCKREAIHALGTPRTDVFFDEKRIQKGRKTLRSMIPDIGDRKIILYAPTYRGNSIRSSYNKNMLDYEALFEAFSDKYVFMLKLHPLVAHAGSFVISETEEDDQHLNTFIYDVSKECTIEDALCGADIVISDYSSLIFEYSLLLRPMVFFAYDLEEYDASRSFYFPYESFVPGDIVNDTEELITAIKKIETDFDVEQVRKFRDLYMSACDGHSTEKIVNYLLSSY